MVNIATNINEFLFTLASLQLTKLHITNYKNYDNLMIDFHPAFNIITGANGAGKTNLIDSIHYLGLARSYFQHRDLYTFRQGTKICRLAGHFIRTDKVVQYVIKLQKAQAKIVERNSKKYEKLVDHIGQIPVVMIAPKDQLLISEGSEERRKLIDATFSQIDPVYLRHLIQYKYVLKQRNQMLKANKFGYHDQALLDIYDEQLIQHGEYIFEKRLALLEELSPIFQNKYQLISGARESCSLKYKSKLKTDTFKTLLQANRDKDCVMQRTTVGIHKDDLAFYHAENMIRYVGSQGQQKSYILALKLAVHELIMQHTQIKPIILLDDIFDKLDGTRVRLLLDLLHQQDLGQVFITDTDTHRLNSIFKELNYEHFHYQVEDNKVRRVSTENQAADQEE